MSRKNTKGTILAIDMGNTNIVIGCVDDDKVIFGGKAEYRPFKDRAGVMQSALKMFLKSII